MAIDCSINFIYKMEFNDDAPFYLNFYASEKFLDKDFDRHQKSWELSNDVFIVATNHFYNERVLNLIPSIVASRATVLDHGEYLYRDARYMRFLFTAYEYFCFGDDTMPFNISIAKKKHAPFKSRTYPPEVNIVHESKYVREENTGANWLHIYTSNKFRNSLGRYSKVFNPNSTEGLMIYGTTHEYKTQDLLEVPRWTETFREGLYSLHDPDPSDYYEYQFTHHRTYIYLDHEFVIDWHDRHSIHDTSLNHAIQHNDLSEEELSKLLEKKTYDYNKKLLTNPEHGRSHIREWDLINTKY